MVRQSFKNKEQCPEAIERMMGPEAMTGKDNENRIRILWKDWLRRDLLLGIALELLLLFVSVFLWRMRFPKLSFQKPLLLNLLFLVCFLPFLNGVLGLWARTFEKQVLCRLLTRLSLPVFLAGAVSTAILCFVPPYCSATDRPAEYLQLDGGFATAVEAEIRTFFPEDIPPASRDIRYRYYKYSSIFEDSLHISLGVTMTEEAYRQEAERLNRLPILQDAERVNAGGLLLIEQEGEEGSVIHVTMDDDYSRVIYSISASLQDRSRKNP